MEGYIVFKKFFTAGLAAAMSLSASIPVLANESQNSAAQKLHDMWLFY